MINVGMYYNVKEGQEAEFERIFSDVTGKLKASGAGIRDAKLYREIGKREYLIYTEWDSLEAFKAFMQSQAFNETTGHGKEILEGRPRHRIFADVK
ncbi:MAG: antibiotic biosynthesis monooxygenase family protein [Candidatus Micrarchaeaceae archaeon]